MIGYRVTSKGYDAKRNIIHDPKPIWGWYEGDPVKKGEYEKKAAETIAKFVGGKVIRLAAGGPVTGLKTVVNVVTKPLQGLGEATGNYFKEALTEIATLRSKNALNLLTIQVVVTGDFDLAYKIKNARDWDKLPILLALVTSDTTDEFMGESVIESVIWAHRNFINDIYGEQGKFALEIKVQL